MSLAAWRLAHLTLVLAAVSVVVLTMGLVVGTAWSVENASTFPRAKTVANVGQEASPRVAKTVADLDAFIHRPVTLSARTAVAIGANVQQVETYTTPASAPAPRSERTIPARDEWSDLRHKKYLSESDVVRILRHTGFPETDISALVCTVKNESSFIAHATNVNASDGSHDTGLFQINDLWRRACQVTRTDLLDPIKNAKCAHLVYSKRGMRAWFGFTKKRECRSYQLAEVD